MTLTFTPSDMPLPLDWGTLELWLIVAMARNRVIGRDNQLPWRLPADLAHFKRLTLGHPVVMGRRTFDSIGRPLPNRHNIVVSTQQDLALPAGVTLVNSLHAALQQAREIAELSGCERVMLIGGENLYRQTLPLAHKLCITEVAVELPGDAYFPDIDANCWREIQRENHSADTLNLYDYAFVTYGRAIQSVNRS